MKAPPRNQIPLQDIIQSFQRVVLAQPSILKLSARLYPCIHVGLSIALLHEVACIIPNEVKLLLEILVKNRKNLRQAEQGISSSLHSHGVLPVVVVPGRQAQIKDLKRLKHLIFWKFGFHPGDHEVHPNSHALQAPGLHGSCDGCGAAQDVDGAIGARPRPLLLKMVEHDLRVAEAKDVSLHEQHIDVVQKIAQHLGDLSWIVLFLRLANVCNSFSQVITEYSETYKQMSSGGVHGKSRNHLTDSQNQQDTSSLQTSRGALS